MNARVPMTRGARLPAPLGRLIDRDTPVTFSFDGVSYQGFAGDTIASALAANGRWLLSRSFKYHRPRGALTFAGQDANTLVQLPDEPNVLGDERQISPGLEVTAQNVSGSLDNDRDMRLGKFSKFMPVGFYYRAFYKPKGAWKYWEPLIRRKAGLGTLNLDVRGDYHDKAYLFHDVMVVGAGPAGMTAALGAAEGGASVLLVEQGRLLGGALTYARFDAEGIEANQTLQTLSAAVTAHPRIDVMTEATCNAWFTDNYLPVIRGKRLYKVRAKECILASGAFDQPVVFRNNDLPGIMLASAAQRLMQHYGVLPGNQGVVITGSDDGYLAALDLMEHGVNIVALLDMRAQPDEASLADAVRHCGIALKLEHAIYDAQAEKSLHHVTGVEVRKIIARGELATEGEVIPCDLVCMTAGYMPVYQLACQAGAKLSYLDDDARFSLSGLPKHLHMAGSANGLYHLKDVIADGQRAASAALNGLAAAGKVVDATLEANEPAAVTPSGPFRQHGWPLFAHPKGKEFVDLDEDLQIRDILNATRHGYRDIQLVKRFSTLGMGPSQGRHSALPAARLVAEATQRSVSETGVTTARPPFVAEPLPLLAGRSFDPYRQTPMHQRHLALGASMMPAGHWARPAFYGRPEQRNDAMQTEALAVHNGVGLIDVSTLGGIELRGPDAAELLNRLYTFAFLKQPVGRTRYATMANEQGVIIDDGVSCRLGEEHFYVTATTSGVDRVYQQMLKWNAQWRLDVDITNVTAAYCAVNLAGPKAREVLSKVCRDIDLSPQAFPYLELRTGHLETELLGTQGRIPARLLRVGFVGELGYEIHVPSRFGEALWDLLMLAGEQADIRPFGVEAQRLLRLEKGHIIIGQDTDGMSHPGEIGLEWAVSHKKPFCVGRRAIEILAAQPQTRKLVGFMLPKDSPQPLEGQLVLSGGKQSADAAKPGGDITGNVTSCEYSATLGAIIGLAYAGIDSSTPGSKITIRTQGDVLVQAEVVALPFFDPKSARQEL
ncbi:2Fe-2S iron-sulfur cluster-binding protein [Cobetia sp. MMG027]|uniref:2Fe-2S iron-sulfur cluster-binding protein n=1 Tax=Cobetia sp. MMG027 TaxID=3021980 RepID=UPI0022FE4C3F|nr:2Fe-2S iron-sulfur cluster-binding protein [Cobetia sp. MMG027]MDA5564564.1 2Fe-2S iron-sulfur cluster-binding protein [Cobetia sp. MMG027]